jgi:hypothetical protein
MNETTEKTTAALVDGFNGTDDHLIDSARALLDLDAEDALIPHGIGGHARNLLTSLCARLATRNSDLDYFRKQEKAGKRPFSTALTGKVIDGQLKRILEMEHTILDLMEQLSEQDNLRGAMFASTIEAHKKRIAELEVKANQFDTIERHLARRSALDGFASAGEKIAAMLHLCEQADPSGVLMKQQQEPV